MSFHRQTEKTLKAARDGWNRKYDEALDEYMRLIRPHRAEYERAIAPYREAYDLACAKADAEYDADIVAVAKILE